MNLFFQIQSLQLLLSCMDDHQFVANLLHLISSFSLTRSLLIACECVSIKLIYCIILLSFQLKGVLLISSVKIFWLSLLNLRCVFNINLLFFRNSLWSFLLLSMSIWFFSIWYFYMVFSIILFYFQVELLLNSFYNF